MKGGGEKKDEQRGHILNFKESHNKLTEYATAQGGMME